MLGKTISDACISEYTNTFDAVVAVDVFEHVIDLQAFLSDALRMLRPCGVLIIATGAIDSLPRRLESKWNYVAMPEHMCFLSSRTAHYICSLHGLRLSRFDRFSHSAKGISRDSVKVLMKSLASLALGYIHWRLLPKSLRKLRSSGWTPLSVPDHCLACFEIVPDANANRSNLPLSSIEQS